MPDDGVDPPLSLTWYGPAPVPVTLVTVHSPPDPRLWRLVPPTVKLPVEVALDPMASLKLTMKVSVVVFCTPEGLVTDVMVGDVRSTVMVDASRDAVGPGVLSESTTELAARVTTTVPSDPVAPSSATV